MKLRGLVSFAVAAILVGFGCTADSTVLSLLCGGVGCFYAIEGVAMLRA